MKHTIIITTLVIICVIALTASGVLSSLILFVLLGMIPGTEYVLPPAAMIGVFATAIIVVFNRSILRTLSRYHKRRRVQLHAKRRAQLPHRRYIRTSAHS